MSRSTSMLLSFCRRRRQRRPFSSGDRPLLASETHTAGGGADNSPTTNVLIVHGLLGSGRNWRTVARALAAGAAERAAVATRATRPSAPAPRVSVTAVDLRCHGATNGASLRGRELGFTPPHDISSAAADVNAFATSTFGERGDSPSCSVPPPAAPDVLVGHSLGGKVALEAARQSLVSAAPLPKQLWVLDSPLSARRHDDAGPATRRATNASRGTRPMAPGATAAVLSVVQSVPRQALRSRREAERWLVEVEKVPSAVAAWLCSQLVSTGQGNESTALTWSFDPQGASSLFESYQLLDAWPLLRCPPVGLDLRVVVGGRSDRWSQAERRRLDEAERGAAASAAPAPSDSSARRGTLRVHLLPDAGHWVHVDDQEGLLGLLVPAVADVAVEKALEWVEKARE